MTGKFMREHMQAANRFGNIQVFVCREQVSNSLHEARDMMRFFDGVGFGDFAHDVEGRSG